jgi:hypothetical protein
MTQRGPALLTEPVSELASEPSGTARPERSEGMR